MSADRLDTVLLGGDVVDGTGRPRFRADVGWRNGRIAAIGDLASTDAHERVDVGGRVVCPGFVDIHGHSDLTILEHPAATSKVVQGVTTEVAGNCGLAVAPVSSRAVIPGVRARYSILDAPAVDWTWCTAGEYLDAVDLARPAVDVAILAGHVPIRTSVVGLEQRPPTPDELDAMCGMLDAALTDGAVGCSLGLMYPPSSYAAHEELAALGRVVAAHDALLSVHMRDYGDALLEAADEVLRVAESSGCRLQISHLTAVGRRNWGTVAAVLALVDDARDSGVDVAVDIYPYLAGSTNLSQTLPEWALDGGADALRTRLADPVVRARIAGSMRNRSLGWSDVMLSRVPDASEQVGRTVAELAAASTQDPVEVVLNLLASGDPGIVAFGRSEDDLRAVLAHPASMIGSDGIAVDPDGPSGEGLPHPRYFGTYAGLIERYVRAEPVLELEDAIRRCTVAPADRVRLRDRGRLCPGARADVVVMDVDAVREMSTYLDPRHAPEGIERGYAGGTLVTAGGKPTAARPGSAVRRRPVTARGQRPTTP